MAANNPAPPPTGDILSMLPELSPARAPGHGMSLEETYEDLRKHPLFMTELDENPDEENAEMLAALQALAYEGTPLENSVNFKEQGNECFREKRWADAKEFYGKGILILAGEELRRKKGLKKKVKKANEIKEIKPEAEQKKEVLGEKEVQYHENAEEEEVNDDPEEVKKEKALLETLYVNRAACHLELRNYRSCTLDCSAALKLNDKNVKAFYRSAKALLAVEKIAEADDACARGLEIDASNAALKALASEIVKKNEHYIRKKQWEQQRAEEARRKEKLLDAALKTRNIKLRATGKPPEMEDAKVELYPDPLDPESSLAVPTLLLYPVDYETDFIKGFNEQECLEQHFGYVFPLPWDKEGRYSSNTVECYAETASGGLVKVGKKASLLKVLSGGNVEIVDNLLKIFVLPKNRAEAWVKDFKAQKVKLSQNK
ncbi:hypothetical protein QBC38DRAFT_418653 [Podospora fimiseda]|uniref:Cns1/TTC4 wheel domain-containing protein n=1 Tax=Podospora fimiseda TaxID=252190 RepID=A0AAN7BPB9_9PEZI|nr:hypothetical protein QBC38DRAFT_418653 [Podospora fimiseda]